MGLYAVTAPICQRPCLGTRCRVSFSRFRGALYFAAPFLSCRRMMSFRALLCPRDRRTDDMSRSVHAKRISLSISLSLFLSLSWRRVNFNQGGRLGGTGRGGSSSVTEWGTRDGGANERHGYCCGGALTLAEGWVASVRAYYLLSIVGPLGFGALFSF